MKTISLPDDMHERQLGKMVTERRKVGDHLMWLTKARARGWQGIDGTVRQKAEDGERLQRERLDVLNAVIEAFERATVAPPRALFVVPDHEEPEVLATGSAHG